ncbi:hypothetical protein V502_07735 [Pseudogymnoascus sp. VKM F-4520 (FW-2644)]|nr:hypothetical protein V502_07735 [Pseudogymnoascus sp. VKM F-4520 (FW-2644)]
MSLSKTNTSDIQFSLRQAVVNYSERCQYQSAKWAAELLDALPDDDLGPEATSVTKIFNTQMDPVETRLERNDAQQTSRVFIQKKTNQKGLFLASYALLLAGEKEKTEELGHILGPSDTGAIINKQLAPLKRMLETWFNQEAENRRSQGWLEYLYGLVLAKDRSHDLAIEWLLKSVFLYPWNWGAWLELSCLIRDGQHLNQVQSKLQPHIMALIFSVHCRQELHQSSTALLSEMSQLQSVFPRSLFLQGQRALVFYRMKDLHTASTLFSSMLVSDPLCLDFLDYYSNVLHTPGSRSRLAFITHLASSINRYRPETCCAIGNYYSLSSRHEDAVHYFRLALNLDRNFSSAWTLLGHEYFKLQNSHAAIEAYRRAVDCNNKDYRAFVGLGVVYEGLEKSTFSLHYYRRALALRPDDAELWQVIGGCLTCMERVPQAIEAWKRCIACSDSRAGNGPEDAFRDKCRRMEMLFQLAKAYEKVQYRLEAIKCLEVCLGESDRMEYLGNLDDPIRFKGIFVLGQARLLLARWTGADGNDARARSLASPVGQDSEFVREEENPLRTFVGTEDENDGE